MIGTGDGVRRDFAMVKRYGVGAEAQERRITLPVGGSVRVAVGGTATTAFAVTAGGTVLFDVPPPDGAEVRAGYRFDVPVRFAEDRLAVSHMTFRAGDVPSVPLIEVRP